MMPINPHALNTSLLALPVALASARKLIHHRKSSFPVAAESPTAPIKLDELRAKTLKDTLKNMVGYQHFGIND